MVVLVRRARDVVRAVPSPVRRVAGSVAGLGAAVPPEAPLYLDLVGDHRPPLESGLHVLRRADALAVAPAAR